MGNDDHLQKQRVMRRALAIAGDQWTAIAAEAPVARLASGAAGDRRSGLAVVDDGAEGATVLRLKPRV